MQELKRKNEREREREKREKAFKEWWGVRETIAIQDMTTTDS